MADLLIELFSEEIPAGLQAPAAENLKKLLTHGMVEAGLTYANASAFHTARRLTLVVEGLLDASPTEQEERMGPKVGAPEFISMEVTNVPKMTGAPALMI